jgi:DNA-binding response OmpR family regulator
MGSAYPLAGRSILVVEDEPLIAIEIAGLFEAVGAKVYMTNRLADALRMVEQEGLSAAILDYRPHLCHRLAEQHIPFMFYTGLVDLPENFAGALVVQKPATGDALLMGMGELLSRTQGAERPLSPSAA